MGTCQAICADTEVEERKRNTISNPLLKNDKETPLLEEENNKQKEPLLNDEQETETVVHTGNSWDYPYDEEAWKAFCNSPPGLQQSPVDLPELLDKLPVSFEFKPQYTTIPLAFGATGLPEDLINNGHTIQMNVAKGQTLTMMDSGEVFDLLQFHFHTTSEHRVNHLSFSLEMHLVHQHQKNGNLLVLGIFFDPTDNGKPNDFLASFWDYLPGSGSGAKTSEEDVRIDLSGLMDAIAGLSFYNYQGSLTTPPLSEGVTWIVAKEPLQCTEAQVLHFRQRSGHDGNFRPPQPLNNREIYQAKIQS